MNGRKLGCRPLCRDTEREAKQALDYILEKGDWEAAENIMRTLGIESQSFGSQNQTIRREVGSTLGRIFNGRDA
jgi:hypothetical protein